MEKFVLRGTENRLFSAFYEVWTRSPYEEVRERIFVELWDALLRRSFNYSSAWSGLV